MDLETYKEHLRTRVLLICLVAVAIVGARWLGLLEGTGSGLPARAAGAPVLAALIVAGWLIIAGIGAVGLYRWLQS